MRSSGRPVFDRSVPRNARSVPRYFGSECCDRWSVGLSTPSVAGLWHFFEIAGATKVETMRGVLAIWSVVTVVSVTVDLLLARHAPTLCSGPDAIVRRLTLVPAAP